MKIDNLKRLKYIIESDELNPDGNNNNISKRSVSKKMQQLDSIRDSIFDAKTITSIKQLKEVSMDLIKMLEQIKNTHPDWFSSVAISRDIKDLQTRMQSVEKQTKIMLEAFEMVKHDVEDVSRILSKSF